MLRRSRLCVDKDVALSKRVHGKNIIACVRMLGQGQVSKCSSDQKSKCSNVQVFKWSSVHMSNCSNSKWSNAKVASKKRPVRSHSSPSCLEVVWCMFLKKEHPKVGCWRQSRPLAIRSVVKGRIRMMFQFETQDSPGLALMWLFWIRRRLVSRVVH